jgi:hypothetical protein
MESTGVRNVARRSQELKLYSLQYNLFELAYILPSLRGLSKRDVYLVVQKHFKRVHRLFSLDQAFIVPSCHALWNLHVNYSV